MATSAINQVIPIRPNVLSICLKETKYEFSNACASRVFGFDDDVSNHVLRAVRLVIGRQNIGNISTTTYMIAAYGTFGVMGASLFGTAATLATERGFGWLEVKKATPMPPFAYFLGKVVMSMIFSAIDVLLLLILGTAFGGVHLPPIVTAKLFLTLVAGSLPFCAMGLAIGYFRGRRRRRHRSTCSIFPCHSAQDFGSRSCFCQSSFRRLRSCYRRSISRS